MRELYPHCQGWEPPLRVSMGHFLLSWGWRQGPGVVGWDQVLQGRAGAGTALLLHALASPQHDQWLQRRVVLMLQARGYSAGVWAQFGVCVGRNMVCLSISGILTLLL